jgi:2-oxoglutarate dehydrogenase E1 component
VGRTRAKQVRLAPYSACNVRSETALDEAREKVLPIVIHGDAAFAGQGIWAETLNLCGLPGFEVGGSVHIIANNLIGFTAGPGETASSRFASDVAKRLPIPIFHVNGEDPEAVVRVGRMALEWRYRFGTDAFIDLIGYRRHGHSEVDDPSITQPVLYEKIKKHPPLYEIYAKQHNIDAGPIVARVHAEYDEALKMAKARCSSRSIATRSASRSIR